MRALKIACGISVLFLAVHMLHPIHHFMHMKGEMAAWMFWGLLPLAVLACIFSTVGGVLLVMDK